MPNPDYQLPDIDLLTTPPPSESETVAEIFHKRDLLMEALRNSDIRGDVIDYTIGPRVSLFKIRFANDRDVARFLEIEDGLAKLFGAPVRIIPDYHRNAVELEFANTHQNTVDAKNFLKTWILRYSGGRVLPLMIGESSWSGKPVVGDLATAPHLLIAGTTGSGKSVLINSIITGLLFKLSPDELKFILIDPKRVEFYDFRDLPHLLAPVITDATRAAGALRWTVGEIDRRFELMGEAGAKSIREYNGALGDDEKKLPRIVVIIDELADLMMAAETAREDVENSIFRIAQQGRAAGVHLIVSTQRPSTNIITGSIKANFPTRIAFRVLQWMDSRVILDQPGAEKLLGMGDMLVRWPEGSRFERTQGAYIPDSDLKRLVAFISKQAKPEFVPELMKEQENYSYFPEESNPLPDKAEFAVAASKFIRDGDDELIRRAVALILMERKASTSFLQRRLRIGYNRSVEIIDELEARELISPVQDDGKREILADLSQE